MTIRACIFDAYGTLFDVAGAARMAASERDFAELARNWEPLSFHWRHKQLQYTWLRSLTGQHTDFWQVTKDALDWAMEATGLEGVKLRARLLELYRELPAYSEVTGVLETLREQGMPRAILSNGSPDMLYRAARSAGIDHLLDHLLSVEDVGIFKPDARVYGLVRETYGTAPEEVLFVSSNGWDVAGAASFGFTAIWVNRSGEPLDRLPGRPRRIISDLTPIPALAREF